MRSLYARLIVAFLAVLLLSTAALYRGYAAMTGPQIVRMISGAQAAQANEAADLIARSGVDGARDYLVRLDGVTQMPHYLVDGAGRDVVTGDDRSALLRGLADHHTPEVEDRVVFVTPSQDNRYRLITVAPIPFHFRDFLPYVALVTLAVILLFWLIVADVVRPLRRLGDAVRSFGRAEFGARADVRRQDEIGQLATTFDDMAARIERLVTSERRLLQDVSHELRSPLTRLNIGIELLRTSADREKAVERLQREAGRLSDLVASLLEFVRLEGDVTSTQMAPVPLAELVRDSVGDCEAEAGVRRVRTVVLGEIVEEFEGNAELLRRAIDNVLGNAVRHAPDDSEVTVHGERSGDEQRIEIRDLGPGVREDQLPNLGSAFYRTDESRSGQSGGVGLGLAIARRAIHLHGGSLEIANAHPGLRVTICLPWPASAASADRPSLSSPSSRPTGRLADADRQFTAKQ